MTRRLGQWLMGSLVLWAVLLAVAWAMSEGEPVCEGPLITEVDDSFPPQCPNRIAGVLDVGPVLLLVTLGFGLVGFAATVLLSNGNEPEAMTPANMGQEPEV